MNRGASSRERGQRAAPPLHGRLELHRGERSFSIWPLSQATEACFGTEQRPAERQVPQVSIELDVADPAAVGPAAQELESPEGAIIGISYAPVLHDES